MRAGSADSRQRGTVGTIAGSRLALSTVLSRICAPLTRRTNHESAIVVGRWRRRRAPSASSPSGVCHSVEVSADSLYEAAIVGFSLLKQDGWVDPVAPGTRLEIQVRHPATTHSVSLAQLRRWVEGIAVSPDETLKKRKLKALLAG